MKQEKLDQLKGLGLQGLEDVSKTTVETIFKVIELIVQDTDNKIDDMVLPLLPFMKEKVLFIVDKIHGEG